MLARVLDLLLASLVVWSLGCTPAPKFGRESDKEVRAKPANATHAGPPRLMREHCEFTRRTEVSLERALDGFDVLERWPLSTSITWAPASATWLGRDVASPDRTVVRLSGIGGGAEHIVVHTPASDARSMCETRVEFDAQVEIRTDDGVVDASASGRFTARASRTEAELRLLRETSLEVEAGTRRTLFVALDVGNAAHEPVKIEILGHETRTKIGPGGRATVESFNVVLASNVEPRQ